VLAMNKGQARGVYKERESTTSVIAIGCGLAAVGGKEGSRWAAATNKRETKTGGEATRTNWQKRGKSSGKGAAEGAKRCALMKEMSEESSESESGRESRVS